MNCRVLCLAVVLCVMLALNGAYARDLPSAQSNLRDIKVVKDIRDFAKNHPGLKMMRMTKETGKARNQSVRYTLGVRIDGDNLIAQSADAYNYPAKKDVTVQLTYPEAGTGKIVTYVGLVCEQDTNNGNAYVVAGGIGQRFISIVVEANQTEQFAYTVQYYGTE